MADVDGKVDKAKGRVKEAAGALTGDSDLKAEGKADQASGAIKAKLEETKAAVEGMVDKAKDKLHRK